MARDLEKDIQEGRAIKDLLISEGWKILEGRIKREIKDEELTIRSFQIEGLDLTHIGAEYVRHRERLNALNEVFEIIEEFLTAKKNAEIGLKGE